MRRDATPRRHAALRGEDATLASEAPPSVDERREILRGLYAWLGPDGFVWLAACAVYPQLRFSVTLYLSLALRRRDGAALFEERLLSRLTILPWFRIGRMPPWVRRDLFVALSRDDMRTARAAVDRMLAREPPTDETVATDAPDAMLALTIWRPEAKGLDAPLDAVMADLMLGDWLSDFVPLLRGAALRAVFGTALKVFWRVNAEMVLLVAGLSLLAFLSWPDAATAPHPPGVWWPLLLLAGLAALAWPWLARLRRRPTSGRAGELTQGMVS